MDLFYNVILVKYKKNIIIPSHWCKTIDIAEAINEGLNRNKNHVIFYSKELTKEANFELAVDGALDLENDGCFWAKIVKCFSKLG